MKQVILLYRFNPYHNRRIIKYNTVAEYISNPNNELDHISAGSYLSCANPKNFAYRDGVETIMTVTLDSMLETPDYALIIEQTNNTIESRWFVMDSDIKSGKTTTLALHRDMIADYYEDVLTAPCFIEKATLNPTDPFIFNAENISVNKIKKDETLIQDKSKCAWVVGYLAPNYISESTTITSVEAKDVYGVYADATSFNSNFAAKDYVAFGTNSESLPVSANNYDRAATQFAVEIPIYRTNYDYPGTILKPYGFAQYQWNVKNTATRSNYNSYKTLTALTTGTTLEYAPYKTTILGTWDNITQNKVKTDFRNRQSQFESGLCNYFNIQQTPQTINAYVGKTIKIGAKYYKLNLANNASGTSGEYFSTATANDVVNAINGMDCWDSVDSIVSGKCIHTTLAYGDYYLLAEEVTSSKLSITLTGGERDCGKLPYKMFCIPYSKNGNITIRYGTSGSYTTITMTQDLALAAAKTISAQFSGSQTLYDLQLLPYCPDQEIIVDDHIILMPANSSITTLIKDGNTPANDIGAIYWCAENTGTLDVAHTINVTNVKVESITEMYRLSSPNWNGQFEFNAAKNGGVSKLNIDFTYKPHTPYIHINPNFGRLYGEDFDDARGLICAGDFSLPQTSSAWNTYEIQNKNYQNQFQREIENLEFTQSIAMKQQKMQAAVGVLTGAAVGGSAGMSIAPGLAGATAGATLGAAASTAGALLDLKYQKQLNEEAIDYRQDQFGMQIENIKALPQNLTNVGGMTVNNKVWPIIEHYSCTDEEKQAIELKLYYNGMTVERIGTIADFLQSDYSYIKGKLIRLTIDEDNHFIEMIANEINRGVFIK